MIACILESYYFFCKNFHYYLVNTTSSPSFYMFYLGIVVSEEHANESESHLFDPGCSSSHVRQVSKGKPLMTLSDRRRESVRSPVKIRHGHETIIMMEICGGNTNFLRWNMKATNNRKQPRDLQFHAPFCDYGCGNKDGWNMEPCFFSRIDLEIRDCAIITWRGG